MSDWTAVLNFNVLFMVVFFLLSVSAEHTRFAFEHGDARLRCFLCLKSIGSW